MIPAEKHVVVVGAGPAGLTAAYELAKLGVKSVVLEKDDVVGGLARTEQYRGYHFDMGGHRFFTKDPDVNRMWREVLGDQFLHRGRLSRIYYNGKYFDYPLPALVAGLRGRLYAKLVPVANAWHERLGIGSRFPDTLDAFLDRCHAAGQSRPTPLLLRYGPGDYNYLHQDLYGDHVFPLQVAILLSEPGRDFEGGEFVLTEQRPRMQSRVEVVPLRQGDAVAFAVNHRPVQGARGPYRVAMRHGVSRLRSGQRHTLGIIFHDAL